MAVGPRRPWLPLFCLLATVPAAAQSVQPRLSRGERDALHAVVTAVDQAVAAPESTGVEWPIHVLRASDGSHYVAFSILLPPALAPDTPAVLYVRLETVPPEPSVARERSAVQAWLTGQRSDPRPPKAGAVVAVPAGEMPVGGPAALLRDGSGQNAAALRLLMHEQQRARERAQDEERARREALEREGATGGPMSLLPFEDFDVGATMPALADGRRTLQRALTAGPGTFDLYVGWVDPKAHKTPGAVQVLKRRLSLPAASSAEFGVSSVILADEVSVLEAPHPPEAQTSNPYAFGVTDIRPATDATFATSERLALVFQAINPRGDATGKPDVVATFRLVRTSPAGETLVGTLNPQRHFADTLPTDFDVAKGHPVLFATGLPLRTLARGAYRLQITATDRHAGVAATNAVDFRVVSTPAELLREAPATAGRFDRGSLTEGPLLDAIVGGLRPPAPSPALARALDAAAKRRFVDLLREEPVSDAEAGAQTVLRALAFYALGDTPVAVVAQLQRALQLEAPAGPAHILLGACRAMEGNDREAAAAWRVAYDASASAALAAPLVDAYLRAGQGTEAAVVARRAADDSAAWARRLAAAELAAGQEADAIAHIEAHGEEAVDAQFLLLQALFAGFVHDRGPGATAGGQARFARLADSYIEAGGPHAELVGAWRDALAGADR